MQTSLREKQGIELISKSRKTETTPHSKQVEKLVYLNSSI